MSNKNTDSKTEALLAIDPNKVGAPALKAALERLKKEQEEKEQYQALNCLRSVENISQGFVDRIRAVRVTERNLLSQLKVVNDAKETFLKNGNSTELLENLRKIGVVL
jgi:hypothetical protein